MASTTFQSPIGFFRLAMILIISVDSLRNLSLGAQYGFSLIIFYTLAGLFFFLPTILLTVHCIRHLPSVQGPYLWIQKALGPRLSFLAIWLQWLYNIVWYPTIFAFISSTLSYFLGLNHLSAEPRFIFITSMLLFWFITYINCQGLHISSIFSIVGAIVGTLLPMMVIILLAFYAIFSQVIPISIHGSDVFSTQLWDISHLTFFNAILFALLGIEMAAVHSPNVKNPTKSYPKALTIAGIGIWLSLVLSSLALCSIIPPKEIGLMNGLLEGFYRFFKAFHWEWANQCITFCIILGSLACAAAWLLGPTRSLQIACQENALPKILQGTNKNGMPQNLLILQGCIFTLLNTLFLFIPNINNTYWLLSSFTAQLALVYYILFFLAGLRLIHKKIIPPSKLLYILLLLGILTCIVGIIGGFIPPNEWHHKSLVEYIILSSVSIFLCIYIGYMLAAYSIHRKKKAYV